MVLSRARLRLSWKGVTCYIAVGAPKVSVEKSVLELATLNGTRCRRKGSRSAASDRACLARQAAKTAAADDVWNYASRTYASGLMSGTIASTASSTP